MLDQDTRKEVLDHLRRRLRDSVRGTDERIPCCPVCERSAEPYEVRLSAAHVRELLKLYAVVRDRVAASPVATSVVGYQIKAADELGKRASSYNEDCVAQLQRLDLVTSSKRGWWGLTAKGHAFIHGTERVLPVAHIWNGEEVRPKSGTPVEVYELGVPRSEIDAVTWSRCEPATVTA